ncbi:MAG: GNAT family N-acetyltransferase [Candidatus Adiutrix sp.]|nr:GNAT family N-acetyltransferase [Candidatus Adiutrix sp.]
MTAPCLIFEQLSSEAATHDRAGFISGEAALDQYLKTQASQDMRRGLANVVVAAKPGSNEICGYYTLSAASVDLTDLPESLRGKLPRYGQVPAVLLGRLAVAQKAQGQGLGALLLADAVKRADRSELGWAALTIKAKHDKAASFYRRFGFHSFPHEPLLLWGSRRELKALPGLRRDRA